MLILNITDPTLASSRNFLYEPQRIVSMVGFISPIGIQHRTLQRGGNGKSRNSYFLIHLATFTVQMFPWFSFVWYSAQLMEWGSHKHPFCLRRKQNEYFFSFFRNKWFVSSPLLENNGPLPGFHSSVAWGCFL